jgi:stage II sporulation protein AB (anti-sigma F factor)
MVPTKALEISETVSASAIGLLRRRAACVLVDAGVDEAIVAAVRMCVSEALANAVIHAYPEEAGAVHVVVEVEAAEIVVTVRDHGLGMGGAQFCRDGGGLGLELMRKLTDGLRITSDSSQGTEIRMAFARAAGASSALRAL